MEKQKKKENVTEELHPEENPVTEYRTGFSVALHLLLPVAGLIFVLFHQKTLLNKILLQIDRNCVSVFCPSFSRRERLLKWASHRLPLTWSSQSKTLSGGISDLWHDGSLLCTLINTAIPGACPNPHRHWKKPPTHAQAIAYKYFGLVPMFTDEELSNELTPNLERNFIHYFNELQQAINKVSEKSSNIKSFSEKYVPRGMGLFSGEQHREVIFYVYQDEKVKNENDSTVIVQIRGPYGTYGQAVIPRFRDGLFKVPDIKVMTDFASTTMFKSKTHFMQSFAISFLRYQKKHLGDNIVIDVTMEEDRAKVTYIPRNYGMYEINMVANGELLKGSPFNVHILKNTSGTEENFKIEDPMKSAATYRKRKVLSQTIDIFNVKRLPQEEKSAQANEDENINKISELPKKTSTLHFADVVNEIGANGEKIQRLVHEQHVDDDVGHDELDQENIEIVKNDKINNEGSQIIYKEPILSLISTIEEEETEEIESLNQVQEPDYVVEKLDTNKETDNIVENLHTNKKSEEAFENVKMEENIFVTLKNDFETTIEKSRIPKLKIQPEIQKTISKISNENNLITNENKDNEKYQDGDKIDLNLKDLCNIQDSSNYTENNPQTETLLEANDTSELEQISPNRSPTFRRYSPPTVKLEEYTARTKINKLKIPEKFISEKQLDPKDLKNLLNNSSKNRAKATEEEIPLNKKTRSSRKIDTIFLNKISTFSKVSENISPIKNLSSTQIINANSVKNNNSNNYNNNNNSILYKTIYDNELNKKIPGGTETNGNNDEMNKEVPVDAAKNQDLEESDWASNGNVKKLLQNYQQKPSESTTPTKEHNLTNLRGKIKHLPQEVDAKHEHCSQSVQKPAILKNIAVDTTSSKKIVPNRVQSGFQFASNLNKNLSQSNPSKLNTSPICSDHIVSEVDYRQMSVAEKRKIFAQSTIDGRTTSSSYSSSENENDEKNINTSKPKRHLQFEGLSVMSVLGSLKKSENSDKTNLCQNSTASLPNIIDLPDEYVFPRVVKEKKNFWEEVSSRSSSSLSTTHSVKIKSPAKSSTPETSIWATPNKDIDRKTSKSDTPDAPRSIDDLTLESSYDYSSFNYSTEDEAMNYSLPNMSLESEYPIAMSVKERKYFWEKVHPRSSSSLGNEAVTEHKTHKDIDQKMKAIWNKPQEPTKENLAEKTGTGIYKSENNILSVDSFHHHSLKKYKSVDDSLDNCTIISLDERKKMLLESDCFKNVSEQPSKIAKSVFRVRGKEPKENKSFVVNQESSASVEESSDSKSQSLTENTEAKENENHNDATNSTTPPKPSSHNHFRKAIKYFKSLEAKSHGKSLVDRPKKLTDKKKFTLEVNRYKHRKVGGSLNLPNLSSKFALSNIYNDVFGRGKDSFKGVPNQTALVEALATFSRRDEIQYYKSDTEDDIKFDLFKRRVKSRKRKSLKSIFDVCY